MPGYANIRPVHHANVKWTLGELYDEGETDAMTLDAFTETMRHRRPNCTTHYLQTDTIKGLLRRHGARVNGDWITPCKPPAWTPEDREG